MSFDDKKILLTRIQKELAASLTVDQLAGVMDVISNTMVGFNVTITETTAYGGNDELIEYFLQSKKIEGRSPKTIERYRYIINRFMKESNVQVRDITVHHIRKYITSEMQRGISEQTICGYQNVFSSFFGWLWREGILQTNPCGNIMKIKTPKLQKVPFSAVEIEAIKEACDNIRDKAIVCFLLSTGCRIEEVTRLNIGDIDFVRQECRVFGKGKKERTVFMDDVASSMLRRYFDTRHDDSTALFVGRGSDRMTPGGVRRMMKRLEAVSGVTNIHPHRFRRTLATNLANRGMSIQEVAHILGHENVNTTMKYVCIQSLNVKHHYQMMIT